MRPNKSAYLYLGVALLFPCFAAALEPTGTACQPPEPVVPRTSGDKLFNASLDVASGLMRGRNHRPKDGKVAWAKLTQNEGKFGVTVADSNDTYCTNITHASFLKFISEACNEEANKGKCDQNTIAGLNGRNFQFTWNAGGPAQGALIDALGIGTSIEVPYEEISEDTLRKVGKRGDIIQYNKKGNKSHVVIFDRICRNQLCYISSDGPTNGSEYKQSGWACEPMENVEWVTFTRINRIENIGNSRTFSKSYLTDRRFKKVLDLGDDGSRAIFDERDIANMHTYSAKEDAGKARKTDWTKPEQGNDLSPADPVVKQGTVPAK